MAYFPLFIDIEQKPCLVAGGGKVALRKVQVLLDFGADVRVVAPVILEEIKALGNVHLLEREFLPEDIKEQVLVVAATDDTMANHRIAKLCRAQGILVNAVDQMEDCTFIFPAYVKQKDVVAAFSSSGKSPVITQYLKAEEQEILTELIGKLNDTLGSIRGKVKQLFDTETKRKQVFKEILKLGVERQSVPTEEEIEDIILHFQKKEKEGNNEDGSNKTTQDK